MKELKANVGVADADLLSRRNTRLLLGALSEKADFTLLIGEQVMDEIPRGIRRIGSSRHNGPKLMREYETWVDVMRNAGVLGIVSDAEVDEERRQRSELHDWLHRTWEKLRGDPNDEEHVTVAFTGGAGVVLTGNMTCIDADLFTTEAAEADRTVPRVLKRDRALDHFSYLRKGLSILQIVEEAVLPNMRGHGDMQGMMKRLAESLKPSFPAGRREVLTGLRTQEEYVALASRMTADPATTEVLRRMRA